MSRHLLRHLTLPVALLVLGFAAWAAAFAVYAGPWSPAANAGLAGLIGVLACLALAALPFRRPLLLAPFGLAMAVALGLFFSLKPSNDRDWAPDVARPVTAAFEGDTVRLANVRNFDWQTETDFIERWEDRSYDVAGLRTLDIVNSYWMGPAIAHTLLSFGFADGRYLAFSVEIRRERNEDFSALAGFFRRYERVTIAADERDIVRLRSNIRRENPELYRLKAEPAQVQALFRELLSRANRLAEQPAFYNSLVANCTTEMFGAARAVAPSLPLDWRIVASGYLPDYLYDNDLLDTRVPFPDLKAQAAFRNRALAAGDGPDFSAAIRAGMPDPNR